MPPPMPRFGAPNNLASHYSQYPANSHSQSGLPPPSLGGSNPSFMNANSMSNPFAMNGNALSMSGGFGAGAGLGMPGGTGLASQAAQMSFAGASVQQQGHSGMGEPGSRGGNKGRIREVWKGNLNEEMAMLRQLVEKYPYIAMVRA
jgi:CCR4-NOT transcription complex subunit 7/8